MSIDPPISLADLPAEIIRLIVPMDEESIGNIKLISHSWSSCVLDYLRRLKLPLKRLRLRSAVREDGYSDAYDSDERDEQHEESKKYAFIEVLPPKWIPVFAELNKYRRTPKKNKKNKMIDLGIFYFENELNEKSEEEIVNNLRSIPLEKWPRHKYDGFTINRLLQLQFFPQFSFIESLVLDSFPDEKLLNSALKVIDNLRVKRLEIRYEDRYYDDFQPTFPIPVLDLVRKYKIQQVYVHAQSLFSPVAITDEFIRELIKLNAALHIFRNESVIFESSQQRYWKSKMTDYWNEGISVEIDVEEVVNTCPYGYWKKLVKSHVSIMSLDQRKREIHFEPPYSPCN